MKQVSFNLDNNKTYTTYSHKEYNRYQIDSILYQKAYNRIKFEEWQRIWLELNLFKIDEMIVHKDSLKNTRLH